MHALKIGIDRKLFSKFEIIRLYLQCHFKEKGGRGRNKGIKHTNIEHPLFLVRTFDYLLLRKMDLFRLRKNWNLQNKNTPNLQRQNWVELLNVLFYNVFQKPLSHDNKTFLIVLNLICLMLQKNVIFKFSCWTNPNK